jgi:hypothetical protein
MVLATAGAVAGCVLFTGGTDGYTVAEGGTTNPGACLSPKDCNGQPCCIALGDSGLPVLSCQTTCPAWEQSCAVASDCGDAGACLSQSCTVEGATVQVTTCGPIPICTQ